MIKPSRIDEFFVQKHTRIDFLTMDAFIHCIFMGLECHGEAKLGRVAIDWLFD